MALRSPFVLAAVLAAVSAQAQTPAGGEFRVNTYTTDSQSRPTVALDGSGAFMVSWNSQGQDGSGHGVFARRFTRTGTGVFLSVTFGLTLYGP